MGGGNDATQERKTSQVPDVGGRIERIRCRDAGGEKEKQMQTGSGQNRTQILKREERKIRYTHSATLTAFKPRILLREFEKADITFLSLTTHL